MYLHLDGRTVVRRGDIIGIFDMDTATVARQTKLFLRIKEKKGEAMIAVHDLPRSFLVCEDKIIISDLNTATIKARAERTPGEIVRRAGVRKSKG